MSGTPKRLWRMKSLLVKGLHRLTLDPPQKQQFENHNHTLLAYFQKSAGDPGLWQDFLQEGDTGGHHFCELTPHCWYSTRGCHFYVLSTQLGQQTCPTPTFSHGSTVGWWVCPNPTFLQTYCIGRGELISPMSSPTAPLQQTRMHSPCREHLSNLWLWWPWGWTCVAPCHAIETPGYCTDNRLKYAISLHVTKTYLRVLEHLPKGQALGLPHIQSLWSISRGLQVREHQFSTLSWPCYSSPVPPKRSLYAWLDPRFLLLTPRSPDLEASRN